VTACMALRTVARALDHVLVSRVADTVPVWADQNRMMAACLFFLQNSDATNRPRKAVPMKGCHQEPQH
jgi:hypothetical protein